MRRPHTEDRPTDIHRTGDIKKDLTEKQLAAIGAVTLAYNILEDQLDGLLFVVTVIPDWLFQEVSTRIHGLDGKMAIIQKGIKKAGLDPKDLKIAEEGVAMFGEFKTIRDCIDHARIINASIGIGLSAKKRGKTAFDILLTEEALNICYDHIVALDKELFSLSKLLAAIRTLATSGSNDPNKSRNEEEIRVRQAQFQASHSHRLSLKRLPKFPDEDELRTAAMRWREAQSAVLMGWSPLYWPPQLAMKMASALHQINSNSPPPRIIGMTPKTD